MNVFKWFLKFLMKPVRWAVKMELMAFRDEIKPVLELIRIENETNKIALANQLAGINQSAAQTKTNMETVATLCAMLKGDLKDEDLGNPIYSLTNLQHNIRRIETVICGWYSDEQIRDRAYSMEELHRKLEGTKAACNLIKRTILSAAKNDMTALKDLLYLSNHNVERSDCDIYGDIVPESRKDFHLDRYEFASQFVPNKAVLDAACGTGYGSSRLAKAGARRVLGVDLDNEATQFAMRHYANDKVSFKCSNILHIGETEEYDVITGFETIEHCVEIEDLMRVYYKKLKPGGTFIGSVPNNWQDLEVNSNHVHNFTSAKYLNLLRTYFSDIEFYKQNSRSYCRDENHSQSAGIFPVGQNLHELESAEVIIAVCRK